VQDRSGTSGGNMTVITARQSLIVLALAAFPSGAHAQSGNPIQSGFRGKIVYEGYLEGTMRTPGRPIRNLNMRSILQSATRGKSQEVRASLRYEVEYSGQIVRGTHRAQGSMQGSGTFTGTRDGTSCDIVFQDGLRANFFCDANRFASDQSFTDARGRSFNNHLEAHATAVVDFAERDRQNAIAQQQARQAAAAEAARYAALPNAGAALVQKFEGYVQTDSRGWAYNKYNPGSLRNVKIVDGSVKSGNFVMRGDYSYNGGSKGWVMAKMSGGRLECIQFWDAQIGCRGLRTPEQGQAMRSAVAGAIAGGVAGGSGGGGRSDDVPMCTFGTSESGQQIVRPC
jgi:hypothetical protein